METTSTRPFAGCFAQTEEEKRESQLVFVGLPDDSQSTYRKGCRKAPDRIRNAYNGTCYNSTTELGMDLEDAVRDAGNLESGDHWSATANHYRTFAEHQFSKGNVPFFVGGDHAVTVPVVQAAARVGQPIHVLQIDAHPDLYPAYDGSSTSHACTAARLLEMTHVASITQIGIRTLNRPQAEVAEKNRDRLHIISAREFSQTSVVSFLPDQALIYLTVDLDGLDPSYAPGVSHPVPGGLSARSVLNLIQTLPRRLIGMDVVEVNPDLDVNDQTSILAGRLLHEAMGRVRSSLPTDPDSA